MVFKKLFKIILYITGVLMLLAIVLFDKIDNAPYKEQDFYKATIKKFREAQLHGQQDSIILAGWSKANITPRNPIKTAGYGITKEFTAVGDSIFIKTIVLGNSQKKVAVLTADLLIFPPLLARDLKQKVKEKYPEVELFFAASHTHSSAGGWSEGMAGALMAGGFEEHYYKSLVENNFASIEKAIANMEPVALSFNRINAGNLVENRLVKEKGIVYPWLNNIKLQKISGEVAVITSFSAHPTCNIPKDGILSRDYPGLFTDSLERTEKVDFAAFLAGPVGSHGPKHDLVSDRNLLSKTLSDSLLAKYFKAEDDFKALNTELQFFKENIALREPHLKVSNGFRFRPWVYNLLMGNDQEISLSFLRLGHVILAGTPCDFSGELVPPLDSIAHQNDLELVITSFNGAYIGYITKDEHYHLKKSETQEMNWFGPHNGQYFSELIAIMINKMGKEREGADEE